MKIALLFLFALAGFVSSQDVPAVQDAAVHHVSSKADLEAQLEAAGNKLVVVEFYTNGDISCWFLSPKINQLAEELKGEVVLLKVDVDKNRELATEYKITGMPTFVYIRNKKERKRNRNYFIVKETIERLNSVIHDVSSKDDLEAQLEAAGNKLVVVDFYATWCGPCKQIAPKIEQLAKELKDEVVFLKVDVDKNRKLLREYKIRGMPTFVYIRNKEELERNHFDLEETVKRLK